MAAQLRERLGEGEVILAPGTGDALGARLIEQSGFSCVYMSGYHVSATLGYPDVGLATLSEMLFQAAHICSAVSIPVIADADNGHGNAINVIRTIREFERIGVAGVHLEDQVVPKKCGYTEHQELVSSQEMCRKIEAALGARRSQDFLVMARSDAMRIAGIEENIRRCRDYRAAGADAVMYVGARSVDDLRHFRDAVDGPLVVTAGSYFDISQSEYEKLGYQLLLYPLTALRSAVGAVKGALVELNRSGTIDHRGPSMASMEDLGELLGMKTIEELEKKYATTAN
jgi:2-methylisocitrate lyase-like PEP mutase family enzyme